MSKEKFSMLYKRLAKTKSIFDPWLSLRIQWGKNNEFSFYPIAFNNVGLEVFGFMSTPEESGMDQLTQDEFPDEADFNSNFEGMRLSQLIGMENVIKMRKEDWDVIS